MSEAPQASETIRVADQAVSAELATSWAGAATARILVAETQVAGALGRALTWLQRAGVAAERIEVQTRRTGKRLEPLAQAGVQRVEWTVAAPVPSHPGFAALGEALDHAATLGVQVSLRWPVSAANTKLLAELPHWWQQPHPALRAVVLEPELASDPPILPEVEAHWPPWRAIEQESGPKLLRSQRWPACLQGRAHAVEPASTRQLELDTPQPTDLCSQCRLHGRSECRGMPAALAKRLPRDWPGLRDRQGDPPPQPTQAHSDGAVQFFADCAEVRGLRLGLRTAWRLRLPMRDAASFVRDAAADGWLVALSQEPVNIRVGGHADLDSAPSANGDAEHLAMVGRDPALLQQLLADERALLLPPPLLHARDLADQLDRHRRLGRAYGFPPCCIEAFCDAFVETLIDPQVSDNAWLLWRAARRSGHFDPQLAVLNALLGEACESPLRHLPCRFDCKASLELAEQLGGPAVAPRPALVWRDGSFAWLGGQWDAGVGAVLDLTAVEPIGVTEHSDSQWRALLAELRRSTGIRCSAGQVWLQAGREWHLQALATPSEFPLLLPFWG